MTYVIADPCTTIRDQSCVDVCPVDCIHPTRDDPRFDEHSMLYINPEECIDCDACAAECPVSAIYPAEHLPDEWKQFEAINARYFAAPQQLIT